MRKFVLALGGLAISTHLFAQNSGAQAGVALIVPYVLLAIFAAAIVLLLIIYRPKDLPRVEDCAKYLELKAEAEGQRNSGRNR